MATMKFRGLRSPVLVTAIAAGAVVLSACSGGGGGGAAPTVGGAVSGTLNILVSSAAGSDAGFAAVNKAFTAANPGVNVAFSAVPNENYNQARSSGLTAGSADVVVAFPREVPSYVPASNAGDDARLADAGGFLDLTGQPFLSSFNPTVLAASKYKGKSYSVPTGLSYYTGMFYNKKIFQQNGIAVPTTWQALTAACDALKAKGVVPIGIAGKDSARGDNAGDRPEPLSDDRGQAGARQGAVRRDGEARHGPAGRGADQAADSLRVCRAQLCRRELCHDDR